ncbi:MAG TPA: methyltransferase domain-containing protein [Vicinamibacteria bacterium]|nr:methyltransferase domain-containing protein [Vicinamibacteria bacterium]
MTATAARGRYQGMAQILRYNLPMYAGMAAAAVVAAAGARWLPLGPAASAALLAFAAAVVLGSASSLLVSHYVYDRSGLFRWDWLFSRIAVPASWTVVHAGLDEVTPALRQRFPAARGEVLDIYDPHEMTEPSIARARRLTPLPEPARPAPAAALPVADGSADLVMLFFAAHELRRPASRDGLFAELRRVARPGGRIVVVEHLRDLANALAFGPGFLHFLPRSEWLRVAREAGLAVREEVRLTPFVRAFFLEEAR